MRKILGLTGIRSEYDIAYGAFRAIHDDPRLSLGLLVTGAHLSPVHGNTYREIEKDGFPIAGFIESLLSSDTKGGRVKGLAVQLAGLIQALERENPDFVLVVGDREEAMSAALACTYLDIPLGHVAGGDRVIGNVDDHIRHAVTKLAHLHFVTNEESRARVLRLGEEEFRVFNTGNPGLDRFLTVPQLSAEELSKELGFSLLEGEPYIVVIQHPLSSEAEQAGPQMEATLQAIDKLGVKSVVIYPNSDAGSYAIIEAIKRYEHLPAVHSAKNLPRTPFVNLLRRAGCLLGNSSCGLLEAPLLKLPVVNVGNRQKGRLHAENLVFVPHEPAAIIKAVERALYDKSYRQELQKCSNPYGDGHAGARIAETFATIPIDSKLLVKEITY